MFLAIVILVVVGLILKFKSDRLKVDMITSNFPSPPRASILGFSKITDNLLPEANGTCPFICFFIISFCVKCELKILSFKHSYRGASWLGSMAFKAWPKFSAAQAV